MLCGRGLWEFSGGLVAYMLCGRTLRTPSGLAGGEAIVAMVEVTALMRAWCWSDSYGV